MYVYWVCPNTWNRRYTRIKNITLQPNHLHPLLMAFVLYCGIYNIYTSHSAALFGPKHRRPWKNSSEAQRTVPRTPKTNSKKTTGNPGLLSDVCWFCLCRCFCCLCFFPSPRLEPLGMCKTTPGTPRDLNHRTSLDPRSPGLLRCSPSRII